MTTAPKRRCIELHISTRVSTLTYRNGVGINIVFVVIARRLCSSVHYIIYTTIRKKLSVNLLSFNYITYFRQHNNITIDTHEKLL